MNSIKTLFIFCILAAVGYGVYVAVNRDSRVRLPLGVDQGWSKQVDVEIPQAGSVAPEFAGGFAGSEHAPGGPPTIGTGPGTAGVCYFPVD